VASRFLLLSVLIFCIDLYIFSALKVLIQFNNGVHSKVLFFAFWLFTFFSISILLIAFLLDPGLISPRFKSILFAVIFIVYFSKLFLLIFVLFDDLFRLIKWVFAKVLLSHKSEEIVRAASNRSEFLLTFGILISSIPFFSMIYGIIRGPYRYRIKKVYLKFRKLPKSFSQIRVIQISDLHLGSFSGPDKLLPAIDMILSENADIILFTGDMVNYQSVEISPYLDALKKIKAPLGVYAVLGNHDYGDYYQWPDHESKATNMSRLLESFESIGWILLRNEYRVIRHKEEHINIIGVENWSALSRFPRYGDLEKASVGMDKNLFSILMSHDPSHWMAEIIPEYSEIDLVLSGHTHGFQFGVDIPGFQWSPVQYIYRQWAGLYKLHQQYLYVNRGLGFIGYPGRVGIMPEITVLNLKQG
jgi:uncharacterized protein